jgi:hypothetical protein
MIRILAIFAFLCQSVHAQNESNSMFSQHIQDAFSEVIVDHTITPKGHEFYRAFVAGMNEEDQQPVHFSSISVEERPHSLSGSLISVESEQGQLVHVTVYAGSNGQTDQLAQRVSAYVRQQLMEREMSSIFLDPDFGRGDFN